MALTAKKVYAILKRQISDMEAKLNSPVRYRGTVATADLLPLNPDIGDMYNIESKSVYGEAGMNVAWNGVVWDTMGAPIDMSLYIKSDELADWAKQQNKPTYTAEEVGALPDTTVIPSKTSDLQNDSGFLTKIPDNYLSGTDKTLSVSGKAADAKATGDKITELSADISNKLNKNQGSENSGKIAGINESGDIVPMFPVSVDYNEETNCLEFGSDQKMELNKGINLDSTLTKTGYAADAGTVGEITNSLKEDLADIDYIVFKDKINKLTFNSEGSSNDITLNGNTITSINAVNEQYKAFINTSLFENNKKYIVVITFKNNSDTNIKVYVNAFSYKYESSIGKIEGLKSGEIGTSVMIYTCETNIRGFSIRSTTDNASYTADIYVYDVTDKDISNIDFSVGGTKIKILKSDLEKPYLGKILCTYGDSITAQQTWQDYVQRELGFSKYYNHGVGGRRLMLMATDKCLAEITEDFDVMLVMGGTNDWAQDRTIGTENDINTDDQTFTGTFYGGLNALMKKLTTKYPTKKIVFMTQTPTKNKDGESFFLKKGSADGLKNSNGNTTRDFAKATLNACGNNHVPCIDLNSLVGWNKNNISSFVLNEDGMFFHPTSIGGKRMAECISGFLKSIQSIN